MTQVYQDQIWQKSQCRQLEHQARQSIKNCGGEPFLIDALDVNRTWKKKPVTDNVTDIDHIPLYPEFWGTFSYEPTYQSVQPTKIFNCFINRVCTTRQSWFYQFVRRNLLHFGSVSFLLDSRNPPTGIELYDSNFQGYEIFRAEHELMRKHVPFCNFTGDLDQVVLDTHISLIIETYFDWPGTIALSEKIFRALQLPRPLILFSAPGSVAVLKKYGFDVWDDIVDHSYDNEQHPIQRQIQILDQLCNWREQTFSSAQLTEFESRAEHNRTLLRSLRAAWPDRLKTVLHQLKS